MFLTHLRLNILLGICISICIVSVLCIDEIDIQEENVHVFEKPIKDGKISEILTTKRSAPKAATPKASKPLVKYACEKSKLQVTCPKGQVIHLLQASYGRKTLTKCNPNKNKKFNIKCKSNKSDKIMRDKCHQKNSCTVEASNAVFGDPCRSTIKYLEMRYKCVTPKVTTKILITKKTTPKRITPKMKATTRIPLIKDTPQQVTTLKNEETTKIFKTETPTQKDSTFKDTTLEAIPSEAPTKDPTTIAATTLEITTPTITPTTTETVVEETTTPPTTTTTQTPTVPITTTTQIPTVPITTTTQTSIPTSTKPRVTAPDTDCDEDDLDCIIKDLGDKPKWFVCETDMGSYPHPTTKKLFIFCLNWKPSVKKCGQNLVFSEDLMTCVPP